MAQKSKEKQQIQQEILDNRRAIQRYEVQMSGVRTLIARYEDEYDDLRSAIGNLSTVIQNIEGIQTYYNHVICTYTGEIHQWWGSEYNYADLEFGHIDTDVRKLSDTGRRYADSDAGKKNMVRRRDRSLESTNKNISKRDRHARKCEQWFARKL